MSLTRVRHGFTVIEILVVIGILGVLVALMLPAVRSAREPARRNVCKNNLKQIALALHSYHDEHGSFPPAYTVDEQGNPLHSWRTLILPYIEEQALYEKIDLAKPWDDPVNAWALEVSVKAYQCVSADPAPTDTSYFAVVGPECLMKGPVASTFDDIRDGTADTVCVVEAPRGFSAHWMEPTDLTSNEVLASNEDWESFHPGIFQALFADGHVASIQSDIPKDQLRSLLTAAAGD